MNKILYAIRALKAGVQLANVETWKKRGVAVALVTALLSALAGLALTFGWLEEVDTQTIAEVASALVTLVGVVLGYLQVATTEKIGIKADDSHDLSELDDEHVRVDELLELRGATESADEDPGRAAESSRRLWLGE